MTAVEAPAQGPKGFLRSVARAILWPVRRFFDPRFTGIHEAVNDVKRVVIADMDAANEASVLTGRTLDTLLAQNEAALAATSLLARLEPLRQKVEGLHNRFLFDPEAEHPLEDLDDDVARILNYASSHDGFASQANLWFNPPVLVGYKSGEVGVRWVNERVAEIPYAFRALSRVAAGGEDPGCRRDREHGQPVASDSRLRSDRDRPASEPPLARASSDRHRPDRGVGH